jgi:hypothetical protein
MSESKTFTYWSNSMRFISLIEVYEETDQRLYDRDSAKNETLLSAIETNYSLRRIVWHQQ